MLIPMSHDLMTVKELLAIESLKSLRAVFFKSTRLPRLTRQYPDDFIDRPDIFNCFKYSICV